MVFCFISYYLSFFRWRNDNVDNYKRYTILRIFQDSHNKEPLSIVLVMSHQSGSRTPRRDTYVGLACIKKTKTLSTLGLFPGISVYTGTKCRAKLWYYNLARSILVLQFEVDQALHLARANLAPHFT